MDQGEDNQDILKFLYLDEYAQYNLGDSGDLFNSEESYDWLDLRQQAKYDHLNEIYDTLCIIEYDVTNKKMDMDVLNKRIINAISLIKQLKSQMPTCILIKLMQISQNLQQLNYPNVDDCIIEYQQFVKKYEEDYNKLNLLQNTENDEIFQAFIYDYEDLKYISLSPNEKYLLVGTSRKVYLYDILTKQNRRIHNGHTIKGLFSQNSKTIVLQATKRTIIKNINTNKNLSFKKNHVREINCFMNNNYLHLICSKQGSQRIIKIDLKSNRQIFSLNMPRQKNQCIYYTSFLDNLITLQSSNYFKIFNEKTRKFTLTLKLHAYRHNKIFLINNNQMLSKDNHSQLIILNIDYKNKRLIKNRILPFFANDLYRGQRSFGYFYLVYNHKLQIIDENYNSIFQSDFEVIIRREAKQSIQQLNSNRLFIIFKKDGIYILKRHQQG